MTKVASLAASTDPKTGESPVSASLEVFDVKVPKYRRHKKKYARVVLNGREVHLGVYGTPESRAAYERVVSEWLQSGRKTPRPKKLATARMQYRDRLEDHSVLNITELAVKYFEFAQKYYVKNGKPTSEVAGIRLALRDLRKLYGDTAIEDFGPTAIKVLRNEMIRRELARSTINKQVRRITRMFRWAVSEGLVKPDALVSLQALSGLKAGRTDAREPGKIKPVPNADVEAIRPHVSPVVMAMIDLQKLTGMRPSEVVGLRTSDIDVTGSIWEYRPPHHKTEHHGKERLVYLGPLAQAALTPWLRHGNPDLPVFSPADSERTRHAELRAARKTKVQPSQLNRRNSAPRRKAGQAYDVCSYRRAITRACQQAGISPWHPNQLRHLAATNLRREFGIEIARAVLGHSTVDMTEVYAEMDAAKARDAMAKLG